jgi:drug/metabolite transporter (DMT)-like permease
MTFTNWIFVILTATLFGSSFPLINIAVVELPPIYLAAARVVIASVIVLGFLFATGRRLPPFGVGWVPFLVLGVLTAAIPYSAIAFGQAHITSSLGGILFSTIPIFTVILAPMFVDESRLTATRMVGVAIAFVGVVTAIGFENLSEMGPQSLGAAITLLAALSYAMGNIYARAQTSLDPFQMAAGQLLTASAILVPISLVFGDPMVAAPGLPATLAVIAVGVFSTALPVLLMFTLVKRVGATRTSLLAFFIPIAAVLLGVLLLGETLTVLSLFGFALIICGAIWVSRTAKQ